MDDPIRCPGCGHETLPGRFCGNCGSVLPPPSYEPPPISPDEYIPPAAPPPPAPKEPKARPNRRPLIVIGCVGLIAMAAAIFGSLLTWVNAYVTSSVTSIGGWSRDGRYTVALAAASLVFLVITTITRRLWPSALSLACCVALTSLAVVDMLDVIGASGGSFSGVGLGLVIVAAGGALGILSCCAALSLKRSVQSPTEAAADETQPLAEPA